MEQLYGNIYRNARRAAGLTQERWAEFLGISVDSVRDYETGLRCPPDELLLQMADISGMKILPYWHLSQKSRLGSEILPEVEEKRLPEAVLALLVQLSDFRENEMQELTRIAADGKISPEERKIFQRCLGQLQLLIRDAYALGYAKEENDGEEG